MKRCIVAAITVVCAICVHATDYTLDLSAKSGNVWWDQNDGLWSGGTSGTAWYPYPEPDAQGNLPNLAVTLGSSGTLNLCCYGKTDTRQFPMSFNSITFNRGNYHLLADKQGVTFAIGAGGFTTESVFGEMSGSFSLLASQTWKQNGVTTGKSGIHASISAGSDVMWTVAGQARLVFDGSSLGQYSAKTYSNAGLFLSGTNQFNRFGTDTLTLTSESIDGLASCPRLVFHYPQGANGSVDVDTPIVLDLKTPNSRSGETYNWVGLACDDSEPDMCVNLTQAISGSIGHRSLLLGQTGHHPYKQFYTRYSEVGLFRGDQQRLVFSGDNSGLVPYGSEERKQILVTTIISAAHQNALGTDNAAFDLEFSPGMFNGFNGRMIRGIVGLTTRNGVSIGANLTGLRLASTANMALGHMPTVLLGTDDGGKSVFSGTYSSVKSSGAEIESYRYDAVPEVRFTAGAGGEARFTGVLTMYCLREVSGLGDVVLANGGNKWANDIASLYGFPIRSGRLVVAHNDAVKSQKIRLGGSVPSKHYVRCMSARMWSKSDLGNEWPVLSNSDSLHTNNVVTFTSAPAKIDGISYAKDDVVVVNAVQTCDGDGNALSLNGVWKVMNDDRTVWQRVDWLDDDSEVKYGHGIRIKVEEGAKFGGRSFFLPLHEDFCYSKGDTPSYRFSFSRTAWLPYLCFHDEAANEPDVGFMAEGARTIANNIDVTENLSAGKSVIGGTTADESTFTGTVSCYKNELTVSAVQGGKVTFSGNVTNANNVATTLVKEGLGEVVLSPAANKALKLDGDILIREGSLTVPAAFVSGKTNMSFVRANGTVGTLNVVGDCDLTGKTLTLTGFGAKPADGDPTRLVLMTSTGTLSGQPTVIVDDDRWSVRIKGNQLVAGFGSPLVIIVR